MAEQVQRRRGTTAQHASFIGALGEITIDTDRNTIIVHDASRAGGYPALREDANVASDATTARTLTATDGGRMIRFTSASAVTVTLPENNTEMLPVGFQCAMMQDGAGKVSVAVEGSDVTHSAGALVGTATQYSVMTVVKLASGIWALFGGLG